MRSLRALVGLLLLCVLFAPWPAAASHSADIYTVKPGDTLAKIAAAHGVSTSALIQANGIANPDMIRTGQVLTIPGSQTANAPAGPAAQPATGQEAGVYTVKPGDFLAQIAAAHGVTAQAIVRANGITNPDLIRPGQVLLIPGSQTAKAAVKPAAQSAVSAPPPVPAPAGGTGFVVSVSRQRCYLFQGGSLTDAWPCSTARAGYWTRIGNFRVQTKLPRAYGSRWGFWLPYWLGIYYVGGSENGIHGLPYDAKTGAKDWGNKIGTPISFGCIVLQDAAAQKLYSVAYIGMPVNIRY